MPGLPEIGPAAADDLPQIAAIHVKCWQETYVDQVPQAHLDSLNVRSHLGKWQEFFARENDAKLVVARVDGTLAGFISFGRARDPDPKVDAEIYAIYLLKRYWGAG